MKKLLLYSLLALTIVACKKSNEPDQRPDERLSAGLAAYQTQLTGAQNGWIGYLFPEGGGGYTFKFKFDNKNRVITYADLNATTSTTAKESSYRLKAVQLPTLYFDTYTYLHTIADPDPNISGGTAGLGNSSDFEFSIVSSSPDTIKMKGNLHGSTMMLIRAKADQGDDYISKAFANNTNVGKIANFPYYYNKLTIAGKEYNITINTDQHTVSFYYNSNGFKRFTTEYATAATGIVFREPFVDGAINISEFHDFVINSATATVTMVAGTTAASTANVATPLAIDLDAPTRMYVAKYDFTSDLGFTINGVQNAQNVTGIPGYLGLQYSPGYGSGYDALIFYYVVGTTQRSYGPAFLTQLTADGKFIFNSYAGNFGTSPGTAGAAIITNVRNQLLNTGGYYAFQTGKNSYDIVSVTDSKIWMRFY